MEPHDVERTMQFLLAQQAQFATDLQQTRELLKEHSERSDQRHGRVTEALMALTVLVGRLEAAGEQTDRRIDALTDRHEALTRKHEELAEAHKETQSNLSALMLVVEKYFRDRTNGGSAH